MQAQKNSGTILVGEDELEVRAYLEVALKCLGYSVEVAQDGDEILSILASPQTEISAVLLDLMMPQRDGIETLREIRRIHPTLPVIIVSGAASTLNIVSAMKTGASDFLCKPVAHEDLRTAINRALESCATPPEPVARPSSGSSKIKAFVSLNPRMQEILSLVENVGSSEAPVLIQGETGAGKEVLARELHAHSPRAANIFLKLNCAALPSELVESELFGYERGAFTGAFQRKVGMFEAAEGGTIFLDEIADMDVRLQAKLLQVLQDREFQRIGGKDIIKVDVRVMAATHRDLEMAIADRCFREDLYYRLNVINLHLPPLRDRKEDILPLAQYLLNRHLTGGKPVPRMTPNLEHAMMNYHWPGNVRELENVMRRLIVLRDPDIIARELHARAIRKPLVTPIPSAPTLETHRAVTPTSVETPILEQVTKVKQQAETDAILAALNSTRWNRKQAAMLLKIDYKALLYKMKKLGIEDKVISPFSSTLGEVAKAAVSGS
jgi:two-component system, NtrC family, response regulator AtoC